MRLLGKYRALALVKGEAGKFGNTNAEYEAIVLDLLAAVGAQDLMPRVKRLENVFCEPITPQKCFSVSRELVMSMPDCRAYVEGVMFNEGFLFPIGHAMVRDGHGRLRDLSQKEVGSVYFCVEFEAAEFRAAMADPRFVAEYERHTEFPYIRACLVRAAGQLG
jgi:hypothetical protein